MSDLQQTLRQLHRELGEAQRLDPDDRAMLESALADIQRALQGASLAPTASAGGDALEGAAVRLEAGHPGLAAAVRALVDALSKAGI
ncbi:MAG TPA: DUF4404 family protein [Steroidobacteraceae bacterium]|nr:DUF4404 family protein [Steroidobacteraceae bacterium]